MCAAVAMDSGSWICRRRSCSASQLQIYTSNDSNTCVCCNKRRQKQAVLANCQISGAAPNMCRQSSREKGESFDFFEERISIRVPSPRGVIQYFGTVTDVFAENKVNIKLDTGEEMIAYAESINKVSPIKYNRAKKRIAREFFKRNNPQNSSSDEKIDEFIKNDVDEYYKSAIS